MPVGMKKPIAMKPPKGGRPCLLDKQRKTRLLSAIQKGMPLKHAAMLAGISYDTLNRWRMRGEEKGAPSRFRQFCKALRHSQAVAMLRLVSHIQAAGKQDWRAAAWMLERRHPEDFGRPAPNDPATAKQQVPDDATPDHPVLQEIRKREKMRQTAKRFLEALAEVRSKRAGEARNGLTVKQWATKMGKAI